MYSTTCGGQLSLMQHINFNYQHNLLKLVHMWPILTPFDNNKQLIKLNVFTISGDYVWRVCTIIKLFVFILIFSRCSFTACYYCVHCFGSETWSIPVKILFDWDFNEYPVSNSSSNFLGEIQYHPLFNMRSIHHKLYKANKEMNKSKVSV